MLETLAAKIGFGLLFGKMKKVHIPQWVWLLAAGVLLAVGGFIFHTVKVHSFEKTIRADQSSKDQQAFDKQLSDAHKNAVDWKNKYITASDQISSQGNADHEAAITNNAALANSLRSHASGGSYRGQVNSPAAQQSSSEHDSGSGSTVNAPMGQVLNGAGSNLIAVPLDDLITFAQHYDDNGHEVKTWRNDKIQQENLYNSLLDEHLSGK